MHLFFLFVIAISLSMDAFSLSLAYGTLNLKKKEMNQLALMVGIFHFFMPLLGHLFGDFLFTFLLVDPDFILFLILTILGIEMILESRKEKEKVKELTFLDSIFFALAVSFDSFSLGLGLTEVKNLFLGPFLFSLCSAFFTYLGLYLGRFSYQKLGKIATIFGGILLILIGVGSLL